MYKRSLSDPEGFWGEIAEKEIRLTSNGKLVGAKRLRVDKIDQIIIRGLKREHPYIGRSYVYQVSTTEMMK